MGEFEAAFLPCTCWLSTIDRRLGRGDEARAILAAVDAVTTATGLLAEAVAALRRIATDVTALAPRTLQGLRRHQDRFFLSHEARDG